MWVTLALALTFQATGISAGSTQCSDDINSTAPLQFSNNDPDLHPFRQLGRFLALDCCADGFTDIKWYFTSNKGSNWRPWPWFYCEFCSEEYRQLSRENQTLTIYSTGTFDTGWYLCNVSNSDTQQQIQRRFHLVVADCDDLHGHIRVFEQPGLIQNAAINSNLTLTCGGNFGCPTGDIDRHANWSYVSSDGKSHPLLPDGDGDEHYSIVFSHGVKDTTVSSILTVNGVRMSDFSQTFVCHLSTNTRILTWNLTIQEQVVQEKQKVMVIGIGVGVGASALLLGVAVLVYWLYKPQVAFRYDRLRGRLPVRGPNEEHYHDTVVVHSDSDRIAEFVEKEIRQPLKEEGYDVLTDACSNGGAGEIEGVNAIERSKSVILVLNATEAGDEAARRKMKLCMSVAIDYHGTRMVVIEMKDKGSSHSWEDNVEEQLNLAELPKIRTTVTWHGSNNMSRRQKDNLLCTIKSHLPEPAGGCARHENQSCVNQRQVSNSSTTPLIPGGDRSVSSLSQTNMEMEEPNSEHTDFVVGEVDDDVFSNDVRSQDVQNVRPPMRRSERVSSNSQFVKQLSDDSGYAKSPCVGSEPTVVPFKDGSHDGRPCRVIHANDI